MKLRLYSERMKKEFICESKIEVKEIILSILSSKSSFSVSCKKPGLSLTKIFFLFLFSYFLIF